MSWPLSQDYNEAVQAPAVSFADADLRQGQPALNALGLPRPRAGNFADVYELTCPATSTKWAVKCFTRRVPGQRERYAAISRHLRQARSPFMVDFEYLEEGIRVLGQWYPVVKMRWVEGLLLNEFVRDNLDRPAVLQALGQVWLRMGRRLREAGVAHGDLQHGNVILVPGSKTTSLAVKLIDYDGMWVPALAGKSSSEVGHPNFQHPQRLRDGTYNAEVDRFPLLVIATALRALAVGGRDLWDRYDNDNNLLFKEADFLAPGESVLLEELRGMGDPLLKRLVGQLQAAAGGRLEAAPLLEEAPEEKAAAAPPLPGSATPPPWLKDLVEEKSAGGKAVVAGTGPARRLADEERPARQRKRGGVPAWGWAVAAVMLVGTLGGAFFLARSGRNDGSPGQIAQNTPPGETRKDTSTSSQPRAKPIPEHAAHDTLPGGPPEDTLADSPHEAKPIQDPQPPVDSPTPAPQKDRNSEKSTAVVVKPPSRSQPGRGDRQPVPEGEALAAGEQKLRDLVKNIGDQHSKQFRMWCIGLGEGNHSQAVRYAAFKEGRDMAVRNGDVVWGLRMADAIGKRYTVNRRKANADAVALAAQSAQTRGQNQAVAREALRLVQEACAEDDYDLAPRLAAVACGAAARGMDGKFSLVVAAERASKELSEALPAVPAYREALAMLAREPDEPEANLKVGSFRIIHQDAWDEGLPLLARSSNGILRALASRDLAEPPEANAQKELGDGWWEAAAKADDGGLAQRAFRRRAHHWYKRVLPRLTAGQADVSSRMDLIARQVPDVLDPWQKLDVSFGVIVNKDYLHIWKTCGIHTRRWYKSGTDVTVVARTAKNHICLTGGQGGRLIFNGEDAQGGLRFERPDNPEWDGLGGFGRTGSPAGWSPRNLEPGRWYTLRWQLTPTGTKVWVDGELVFTKDKAYDLSAAHPVGVYAHLSEIDVKSVVVKSIPAAPKVKE